MRKSLLESFRLSVRLLETALRLLENEENRYNALIKEIEIGEKSGFVKDFDRTENLKNLHAKHLKK